MVEIPMEEFVCLTLQAAPDESASLFQSRLYSFWTHLLRNHPTLYEQVYSEAIEFDEEAGRVTRRYMVHPNAVAELLAQLEAQGVGYLPVDHDEFYSKAEASSSEWFQIEH